MSEFGLTEKEKRTPTYWNQYTLCYTDGNDNVVIYYVGITRKSREERLRSMPYRSIDRLATLLNYNGPEAYYWKNSEILETYYDAEKPENARTDNMFELCKNNNIIVTGGEAAEKGIISINGRKMTSKQYLEELERFDLVILWVIKSFRDNLSSKAPYSKTVKQECDNILNFNKNKTINENAVWGMIKYLENKYDVNNFKMEPEDIIKLDKEKEKHNLENKDITTLWVKYQLRELRKKLLKEVFKDK